MNRFLQALIAISGVFISGLLGWQALENEGRQARYTFVSLFSEQASTAMRECDSTPLVFITTALDTLPASNDGEKKFKATFEQHRDAVAEFLKSCLPERNVEAPPPMSAESAVPDSEQPAAGPVTSSATTEEPEKPPMQQQLAEALPITVSENIDLRAKENAPYMNRDAQQGPAPADAASGRWYAVLASYQAGSADKVAKHYQSLEPLIGKLGVPATLEVHYTSISRHLAIVLAPNSGEEADARQLVGMVRKYGWAPDAFVQMSRGWRRCADPVSESTLASCPPAAAR